MAEVLPFECEYEAECYVSGWDYSRHCPERCTLREKKRVKELERVAQMMSRTLQLMYMDLKRLDAKDSLYIERKAARGMRIRELNERLEEVGVSVDD